MMAQGISADPPVTSEATFVVSVAAPNSPTKLLLFLLLSNREIQRNALYEHFNAN
jgi:hypothetical protein